MTPDGLYKTILRTLVQVRNTTAERAGSSTWLTLAHDALLDDMARNAAQALIGLLDRAPRDLHAMTDRLTTCLIGAVDQIQRHNASAGHVTSKEQLELWKWAITDGRLATNDGRDPGDE